MQQRTLSVAVGLMIALSSGAAAQHQSFSGTWKLLPDSTPRVQLAPDKAGGSGRAVTQLVITQHGNTLTIANKRFQSSYALDGSETTHTIKVRGEPITVRSRSRWDGDRLTIIDRMEVDGAQYEDRQTLSLQGGALVLEVTNLNRSNLREIHVRASYSRQPEGVSAVPPSAPPSRFATASR